MEKTFYFIAGLPRSGSTLLSAILNQNPRFHSEPNSPVLSSMVALEQFLMSDEHFNAYPKVQQGKEVIASILPQYYNDIKKPVIFDKNRAWVSRIDYIRGYFDINPKIICPVRDVSEVLASFITMIHESYSNNQGKINIIDETLVKNNIPLTDENRCAFISSAEGILGASYNTIKDALMNGYDDMIHFVEYKDLITKPKETMDEIYEFLDEEPYKHKFQNIKYSHTTNDLQVYGLPNMHKIRPKIEIVSKKPEEVLSPQILEGCKNAEFWRILDQEE